MSKELVTIDFSKKDVIATLKQTVAQGLTDPEFAIFAEHCKSTGLNPFKKEVWAIKAGGRLQVMTGINGFMTIANSHPQYDGMEVGLIDEAGEYKPMTFTGKFVGAWAKVHRKDRKFPAEAAAMLKEYKKGTPIWTQMERVMIAKCAKSVAIREAFPQELNGLYTQEEMPVEYSVAPIVSVVPANTLVNESTGEILAEPSTETVTYALPYGFKDSTGKEWRNVLKAAGFYWDGAQKVWIGEVRFPALEEQLLAGKAPAPKKAVDHDDDIPAAFYEGEEYA